MAKPQGQTSYLQKCTKPVILQTHVFQSFWKQGFVSWELKDASIICSTRGRQLASIQQLPKNLARVLLNHLSLIWSWTFWQNYSVASTEVMGLLAWFLSCTSFRRSVRSRTANSVQLWLQSKKPPILLALNACEGSCQSLTALSNSFRWYIISVVVQWQSAGQGRIF